MFPFSMLRVHLSFFFSFFADSGFLLSAFVSIRKVRKIMNGNCNFVFGTALGTALAVNIERLSSAIPVISETPEMQTLFILGGVIGGIFPDIDNPTSYMGKLSAPVSTWIGNIGESFGKSGRNHRGLLHDPFVYLVGLMLSCYYCPAWCGFFVGCLSHLFLDMFNPAGVPFMLGTRHLHLGKITSGSRESVIFTWICTAFVLIAGVVIKAGFF